MRSVFLFLYAGSLLISAPVFAGWPAEPETVKSIDEVFSYYEKFKASNSRLEWARFSRKQGEIFIVWECFWYSSPIWVSMTAYRHDGNEWHRLIVGQFQKLSGDVSVEFRRATDNIIIRDAEREIKSFAIDLENTKNHE